MESHKIPWFQTTNQMFIHTQSELFEFLYRVNDDASKTSIWNQWEWSHSPLRSKHSMPISEENLLSGCGGRWHHSPWLSLKGLATSPLRLSNTLYWSLPMKIFTVICPQRYLEVSRYDDMYTVLFSTGISGQFRLTFLFSDVQHTPGSASSKEKSPRSLVAPGRCCCADGTTNPTCWSLWMAP